MWPKKPIDSLLESVRGGGRGGEAPYAEASPSPEASPCRTPKAPRPIPSREILRGRELLRALFEEETLREVMSYEW